MCDVDVALRIHRHAPLGMLKPLPRAGDVVPNWLAENGAILANGERLLSALNRHKRTPEAKVKDYLFFLSYARNDSQGDPWIREFYERLAKDVRRAATLPANLKPEEFGFIDEIGIESGTQWTAELAEALQCSRVFVCLYSRNYFKSLWCGKEFQIFADRIKDFLRGQPEGTRQPPLIQVVLWDPPDKLPKPLPKIVEDLKLQYAQADFGDSYVEDGLASLIRLNKTAEYQTFAIKFSDRVAQAASEHPLPPLQRLKPWEEVENAFHPLPQGAPPASKAPILPDTVSLPAHFGPEVAWFVYVAGRDEHYILIRNERDSYGKYGGALWKPYSPPLKLDQARGAGIIAHQEALGANLFPETLPLSKELIQHLRTAEDKNTPVVLIVDPWSLHLDEIRTTVGALDLLNLVNCGVIIIWNDQDPETETESVELRKKIVGTFGRTLVSQQIFFRDSVTSEENLAKELRDAIKQAREKIMKRGQPLRPVDTSGGSLPTLPTGSFKQ